MVNNEMYSAEITLNKCDKVNVFYIFRNNATILTWMELPVRRTSDK